MAMLENKIVLVTGGSTGIGRATAVKLAKQGATIAIADIQDAEGAETVSMVEQAGGRADYYHVDVADYDAVKTTIARIVDIRVSSG